MKQLVEQFPYVHLQIELNCLTEGFLPKHKTSIIRGILGRMLRKKVCHNFKLLCSSCDFNNTCVYANIFESPQKNIERLNRGGTSPHPYIIRCHNLNTDFSEDEKLVFEMIFLGNESDSFANIFILTLKEIENWQFGKDKLLFSLHRILQICHEGKEIVSLETGTSLQFYEHKKIFSNQIMIHFLTPLKMQKDGMIMRKFSLNHFLWQAYLRIYQYNLLNNRNFNKNYIAQDELNHISNDLVTIINYAWKENYRYSFRQSKPIKLGGIVPTIQLDINPILQEWLPIIQFSELIHVGKGTTFGLGQFEIWNK